MKSYSNTIMSAEEVNTQLQHAKDIQWRQHRQLLNWCITLSVGLVLTLGTSLIALVRTIYN